MGSSPLRKLTGRVSGTESLPDVCLQRVRLLDPLRQRDEVTDVWLQEGRLRATEPAGIPADIPTIDGSGWVVGPGLLDLYAHSGEMVGSGRVSGAEHFLAHSRETLTSLAAAALAGGFTQVGFCPPPFLEPAYFRCWITRNT